jgi:uncharacterized protein (UPF0305 family)
MDSGSSLILAVIYVRVVLEDNSQDIEDNSQEIEDNSQEIEDNSQDIEDSSQDIEDNSQYIIVICSMHIIYVAYVGNYVV